jgi:serine/threonine-protein kinase
VPFTGKGPIFVMTAHLTELASAPSSRRPDAGITPALDAVVLHALAKAREERYASSTALATALGSALSHPRDVESTAPPPPEEEIGTRDTELSLEPALILDPEKKALAPQPSRTWFLVICIAVAIGIAAGLLLSVSGR